MDLIKMSDNNKYFLFYDNKLQKMKVYEIKKEDDSNEYQFVVDYELDHELEEAKALFEATKVNKKDENGQHVMNEIGLK